MTGLRNTQHGTQRLLGLALAASLSTVVACGAREQASETKIVGGSLVTAADPVAKSTVSLLDAGGRAFCTGSLVDSQMVLTASHCLEGYPARRQMFVGFGLVAGEMDAEHMIGVSSRFQHEEYNTSAMETEIPTEAPNDIAVLFLESAAPSDAQAVSMLTTATALRTGETLTLAGFGLTRASNGTSGTLRRVDVKLTSLYEASNEIEFGDSGGRSACMGDSGGPAFVKRNGRLALVGVTSRGSSTCDDKGIYTDIRFFEDWIAEKRSANL